MKKYLFLTIAIAIGLVACNKSEVALDKTTSMQKLPSNYKFRMADGEWGIHRIFYESLGDCFAPPVNCFDDIIVTPDKYLYQFVNLIEKGDYKFAVEFAKKYLADICEFFTEKDLIGFIEGNLSVDYMINKEGKTFLFFRDLKHGDKEFTAYPFFFK